LLPANDPDSLPWQVWEGETLTPTICQFIGHEGLLNLGGTYGNKLWGDPLQYDELRLTLDNGDEIAIICYNRALGLVFASTETLRAIHRVMGKLAEKRQ